MISYTAEVKCKSWLEPRLELAPSGLRSTALPIELSSQQGLEAEFYPYQAHEIF